MAPGAKSAMGAAVHAVMTALGCGLCVVALYALLFVNLSGNGTLWDSARGVWKDMKPAPAPKNMVIHMLKVPARPVDAMAKAQDRMLMVPDEPEKEFSVPVADLQTDHVTDAPADAHAGKDWLKHLTASRLRAFTVYGDQQTSVSPSAPAQASPGGSSTRAPTPAASFSAYRAGASAQARPGISSRASPIASGASDGVRNFR